MGLKKTMRSSLCLLPFVLVAAFLIRTTVADHSNSAEKIPSLLWSPERLPTTERTDSQRQKQHVFELPSDQSLDTSAGRLEAYLYHCQLKALLLIERPVNTAEPVAKTLPLNTAIKHRIETEGEYVRIPLAETRQFSEHDVEKYVRRVCNATVLKVGIDDTRVVMDQTSNTPTLIKLFLPSLPPVESKDRTLSEKRQADAVNHMLQLLERSVENDYLVFFAGTRSVPYTRVDTSDEWFTIGLLMTLGVSVLLVAVPLIGTSWLSSIQATIPVAPKQKRA